METSKHIHTYDASGKRTCCSQEDKIYNNAKAGKLIDNDHNENDGHDHNHGNAGKAPWKRYLPVAISFALLVTGIALDYFKWDFFEGYKRLIFYIVAYIPVGLPVMLEGFRALLKKEGVALLAILNAVRIQKMKFK